MANTTCASILKVCAMRILRLDEDGSILAGSSSLYVLVPQLLGYTPTAEDRQTLRLNDGCGDTCMLYLGPPKAPDGADLRLDLCQLDAEQTEMMVGGAIIQDGYDTIGYLSPTDSTVNETGVAVETWSLAYAGRERLLLGGQPAFYRHVFPKTRWSGGELVLQDDVTTIPLTGTAEVNSGFGTGLASDPFPADVGESVYGWALVDSMPEAACGYQAVA